MIAIPKMGVHPVPAYDIKVRKAQFLNVRPDAVQDGHPCCLAELAPVFRRDLLHVGIVARSHSIFSLRPLSVAPTFILGIIVADHYKTP
jgi:hypothetical protein